MFSIILFAWQTNAITTGAVVALISLLDHAYTPIAIFNVVFIEYKLDQSAFQRYDEFLSAPDEKMLHTGESVVHCREDIRLTNLSFSYGERQILQGVNLHIKRGEKVAFVGESGAGKSTLIKLLLGLIRPVEGTIHIGTQELSTLCLDSYYQHIAYVSQESPVFDGTLRENLVFDRQVEDELILGVLERVKLSGLVGKLEKGLDTEIGERGVLLSGGERQRLALARLWFSAADIVILDEATSAMDVETEAAVFHEVIGHLEGKTILAIAHRLSTVQNFDRMITVQNGYVTEDGTEAAANRERVDFSAALL